MRPSISPSCDVSNYNCRNLSAELNCTFTLNFITQKLDATAKNRFHILVLDPKKIEPKKKVLGGCIFAKIILANMHRGWSRKSMAQIYSATLRSLAEYASPAWAPWISATNLEKLETQQRKAARGISGVVQSTPAEAVLREAGLEGLRHRYRRTAVCTYDKWRHLGLEDVRRATADGDVVNRTRKDWRGQCRLIHGALVGEGERPERNSKAAPPWRMGVPGGLRLAEVSETATVEEQREAALETLGRVGPVDRYVYTDGAAEWGIRNGDGGAAIYDQDGARLCGWSCPGGGAAAPTLLKWRLCARRWGGRASLRIGGVRVWPPIADH